MTEVGSESGMTLKRGVPKVIPPRRGSDRMTVVQSAARCLGDFKSIEAAKAIIRRAVILAKVRTMRGCVISVSYTHLTLPTNREV